MRLLLLISVVTILSACGGKKEVELLNVRNQQYSLNVCEVDEAEARTSAVGANSIGFSGHTLKQVIADLYFEDGMFIEDNNSDSARKRIKVIFKSTAPVTENNMDENKQVVLNHLSSLFNFKVEKRKKTADVWLLHVKDNYLLEKHRTKAKDNAIKTTANMLNISLENVQLEDLARAITANYKKRTFAEGDIANRYDLIFANDDESALRKKLRSEYGLALVDAKKEVEVTFINFNSRRNQ